MAPCYWPLRRKGCKQACAKLHVRILLACVTGAPVAPGASNCHVQGHGRVAQAGGGARAEPACLVFAERFFYTKLSKLQRGLSHMQDHCQHWLHPVDSDEPYTATVNRLMGNAATYLVPFLKWCTCTQRAQLKHLPGHQHFALFWFRLSGLHTCGGHRLLLCFGCSTAVLMRRWHWLNWHMQIDKLYDEYDFPEFHALVEHYPHFYHKQVGGRW